MKITGDRLRLSASDVANFLACQHLTRLDLLRAHGRLQPPQAFDLGFEDLVKRGEAHEQAVLAEFRAAGWRVAEIPPGPEAGAAAATAAAIRDPAPDVPGQRPLPRLGIRHPHLTASRAGSACGQVALIPGALLAAEVGRAGWASRREPPAGRQHLHLVPRPRPAPPRVRRTARA